MNVTLYGASEETYKNLCHYKNGYEKTMHAIQLLIEAGIDVKVGGTFTKGNVHEIETFMNLKKESFDSFLCTQKNHPFWYVPFGPLLKYL